MLHLVLHKMFGAFFNKSKNIKKMLGFIRFQLINIYFTLIILNIKNSDIIHLKDRFCKVFSSSTYLSVT